MKHVPPNQKLSRKEVGSIISDRDPENKPGELGESNDNDSEEQGESPEVERMEIEGCDNGATCSTHMKQPPSKDGSPNFRQPSKKVFQSHDDFMAHVHQHTKGMFKGGK